MRILHYPIAIAPLDSFLGALPAAELGNERKRKAQMREYTSPMYA
jgi:hypothetical protein